MPLQETIHKWTEGGGSRWLGYLLVALGMLGLAVWYDLAAFRNLSTPEGFDQAQLARNLADGRGYTTDFIRPFSLHLVRQHRPDHDPLIRDGHPDLANAPLYPVLLAGALKAMPFSYPNVVGDKDAGAYAPDRWIAGFNQLLFFIAVLLLFRLGARLFDDRVGWMSAAVLAGTEFFWRLSLSGLPNLLAIVVVLAMVDVLSRLAAGDGGMGAVGAPAEPMPTGRVLALAAAAGVLTGLAGLTRYGLGWLILPVLGFLGLLPGARRGASVVVCGLAFLAVLAPWVARNYLVSGTPFGTAGYAVYEVTRVFPGFELMRTLNPDFSLISAGDFSAKLLAGVREILENPLPRLGGSWVCAFFLVGLLVPFRKQTLNRLRLLLASAFVVLMVVQALGRTEVSTENPALTGENLLVVLTPLLILFGVSLFFMLSDPYTARDPGVRTATSALFLLVASAPMLFSLLRPVPTALAYPPYHPRLVQEKASQIGEKDWMMTDIPWAVAWYGARQSVWLSLRYRENPEQAVQRPNDFAAVHGLGKPLRALYLSAKTTRSVETWGLWSWIHRLKREDWEATVHEWDAFLMAGAYAELEVPTGFPLRDAPYGLWPELFLMDSERGTGNPIKGQ